MKILKQHGYDGPFIALGNGKDGDVYRAKRGDQNVVVKILSDYGRSFRLKIEAYIDAGVEHDSLLPIVLRNKQILEYQFEDLNPVDTCPSTLLYALGDLCIMQQRLLESNLLFWDFGIKSPNYMVTSNNKPRWIDYGGNGILYVKAPDTKMVLPRKYRRRKNLVIAKCRFMQLQFLLHLAIIGMHCTDLISFSTYITARLLRPFYQTTCVPLMAGRLYARLLIKPE
jgi:hypothetical protein